MSQHDAAPQDIDWPALAAEALAGRPARLLAIVASPNVTGPGINEQRPQLPPEVVALVADLRRVRRGRPAKGDTRRVAATEWQRLEARTLYALALRLYQVAKDADLQQAVAERITPGGFELTFGVRSRTPVVRGGGLSPKELAIDAVARAVGRTPEAVRRLIFASAKST